MAGRKVEEVEKAVEGQLPLKRGVVIALVVLLCLTSGAVIVAIALRPEEPPDTPDVPFSIKELSEADINSWVAVCESLAAMRQKGTFKMRATTLPAFAAEVRAKAAIEPRTVFDLCKQMGVRFTTFVLTTDAIVSAYVMDEVLQAHNMADEEEFVGPELQLPEIPEDVPEEVVREFERLYATAPTAPTKTTVRPKLSPVQSANTVLVLANREKIDAAWNLLLEAAPEKTE